MNNEPIASKSGNTGRTGIAIHASHTSNAGNAGKAGNTVDIPVEERRLEFGLYLEKALAALNEPRHSYWPLIAELPSSVETWRAEAAFEHIRVLRSQLAEFVESEYENK